ncbi:MAG: phosphate ABC transporter permease subunit PstC [Candidatus Margulisiibacteriota bacterium]
MSWRKQINKLEFNPDRAFKNMTFVMAAIIPVVFCLILLMLIWESIPSIKAFGFKFLVNSHWNPITDEYGALPYIYGTLASSFLALLIAVPLGLGCSIFLSEIHKSKLGGYISTMVDLLAAIPSVVYGLWGIFILGPFLSSTIQPFLGQYFGFLPIFQGPPMGLSLMTGGIILAIMILPTITAVSREVFQAIPNNLRESAIALGANKLETVKMAVLPPAVSGIVGAVILALGRAVGETMAVTMVIGNRPEISGSIFAPSYTLASVIANEFAEASSPMNLSAIFEIGIILLLVTVVINGLARILIWKIASKNQIQ